MRSRWFPLAIACAGTSLTLSGCAYSLISRGEVRSKLFDEIVHRTALARNIQPERPVDARVVKRAELDEILRRTVREAWSSSKLRSYQRALTVLGLWPADRDLLDEYLRIMNRDIAGFYLPAEERLYLVADAWIPFWVRFFSAMFGRDFAREQVLAHEVVHLLQHQTYPQLFEPEGLRESQDDLGAAIRAAVEGDATLYGVLGTGFGKPPPPETVKKRVEAELAGRSGRQLTDSPALIRFTVGFPYAEGYRLAYREHHTLLEHPPASTEQVLHGDKRHESFLALDLRPVKALLPSRCRFLQANTMGELGLSILFRDLGEEVPSRVWKGWDGDRYLAADCDGRSEFLWITAWDSEQDAEEFESAYAGIAEAVAQRASLAAPPETTRFQREVYIATSGLEELRDALALLPRVQRVSNFEAVREHFEPASPSSGDGVGD